MTYVLTKDRPQDPQVVWEDGWAAYRAYLESVRGRMPRAAFEFAAADWHYDYGDHRAPHDGWLEVLEVREQAVGEFGEARRVEIIVRLLAAYHDGHIELRYADVLGYSLASGGRAGAWHGDWLSDEVTLSERGRVLHEVEWSEGGLWLIECADITYTWIPLRPAEAAR